MWNVRQLEENKRKQEDMFGKVEKDEKLFEEKQVEKTGWIKRNGEDGKEQTKRNGGHLERTLVELQLGNSYK